MKNIHKLKFDYENLRQMVLEKKEEEEVRQAWTVIHTFRVLLKEVQIYSWFLRCCIARGSTGFSQVSHTKVEARKSFMLTLESKLGWGVFVWELCLIAKEMKQGVTIIMCIYYNQCYKFTLIENKNILLQYSMQQQSAGVSK